MCHYSYTRPLGASVKRSTYGQYYSIWDINTYKNMIDNIIKWTLFLVWNVGVWGYALLIIVYGFNLIRIGIRSILLLITFPFIQPKRFKKLKSNRELVENYLSPPPFKEQHWLKIKEDFPTTLFETFLPSILVWFGGAILIHFIMAHIFSYLPAVEAVKMTENLFKTIASPDNLKEHFWTLFMVFAVSFYLVIFIQAKSYTFDLKTEQFIKDELRYDWFEHFCRNLRKNSWTDFANFAFIDKYSSSIISLPKSSQISNNPIYNKLRNVFPTSHSKSDTDLSTLNPTIQNLMYFFKSQISNENYPTYTFECSPLKGLPYEDALQTHTIEIIKYMDFEKLAIIFTKVGEENGFCKLVANDKEQQISLRHYEIIS